MTAVESIGLQPGKDIKLALDAASSEFYADGKYTIDGKTLDSAGLCQWYTDLADRYPIFSIEDPFDQDDWDGTVALTALPGTGSRSWVTTSSSPTSTASVRASTRGRQRGPDQGQPDRHAHGDHDRPRPPQGLPLRDQPPLGETEDTTSPTSPSPPERGRSRPALPAAASAWPSTTASCASPRARRLRPLRPARPHRGWSGSPPTERTMPRRPAPEDAPQPPAAQEAAACCCASCLSRCRCCCSS